jgi:hypothetical protein
MSLKLLKKEIIMNKLVKIGATMKSTMRKPRTSITGTKIGLSKPALIRRTRLNNSSNLGYQQMVLKQQQCLILPTNT